MLDKIYVMHYTKNHERWRHITMEITKWFPGVVYEFIECYDKEDITNEIINKNFDKEAYKKKFGREFSLAEMSLCMKFKTCFSKAAECEGENFLFLEDDVIFKEDPISYIASLLNKCVAQNIDFDCVFLGEAGLRYGDNRDVFFLKDHPATNGTCTMLYKKHAVEKICEDFQTNPVITQAMDWELNDRFKNLDMKIYWGKAITKHGSVIAERKGEFTTLKSMLR